MLQCRHAESNHWCQLIIWDIYSAAVERKGVQKEISHINLNSFRDLSKNWFRTSDSDRSVAADFRVERRSVIIRALSLLSRRGVLRQRKTFTPTSRWGEYTCSQKRCYSRSSWTYRNVESRIKVDINYISINDVLRHHDYPMDVYPIVEVSKNITKKQSSLTSSFVAPSCLIVHGELW
jgi:hypothetical protein